MIVSCISNYNNTSGKEGRKKMVVKGIYGSDNWTYTYCVEESDGVKNLFKKLEKKKLKCHLGI